MVERSEAVEAAVRALRAHDRSTAELDERLRARGVGEAERRDVLEALGRAGYVDDERFARDRADTLATRGSGDALIRADLEGRGLPREAIDRALACLEPERERAERLVAERGVGARTARYLASRGFDEDAVAAAVAPTAADTLEW